MSELSAELGLAVALALPSWIAGAMATIMCVIVYDECKRKGYINCDNWAVGDRCWLGRMSTTDSAWSEGFKVFMCLTWFISLPLFAVYRLCDAMWLVAIKPASWGVSELAKILFIPGPEVYDARGNTLQISSKPCPELTKTAWQVYYRPLNTTFRDGGLEHPTALSEWEQYWKKYLKT